MLPRHYEPTGAPSHALMANGTLQPAYRRRSREVGQVGRAGLVGIVWRLLRPFRYLIGSREPARGLEHLNVNFESKRYFVLF